MPACQRDQESHKAIGAFMICERNGSGRPVSVRREAEPVIR